MILRSVLFLVYNLAIFPVLRGLSALRSRWLLRRAQTLKVSLSELPDLGPRGGGGASGRGRPDLAWVSELLDAAGRSAKVKGLWVHLEGRTGTLAQYDELRILLSRFRATGKDLTVHLSHLDNRTWLASSPAAEVTVDPAGAIGVHGLGMEVSFYGEALDKLGVDVEVARRSAYKGFVEPYSQGAPSPAFVESAEKLLADLFESLVAKVASGGRVDESTARVALEHGPFTQAAAREQGLVTSLQYASEREAAIARAERNERAQGKNTKPRKVGRWRRVRRGHGAFGDNAAERPHHETYPPSLLDAADAGLLPPAPFSIRRPPILAFVPVHGAIVDQRQGVGALSTVAVGRDIAGKLDALARDPRVASVALHIDSRGGSSEASDRIWHAARELSRVKPTVAWLRSYAASGGYYAAAGTQTIIASPFTVTGSIGVAWLKPTVERLAAQLGVRTWSIEHGRGANTFSVFRKMQPADRAWLEEMLDESYARFKTVVGQARGLDAEQVEAVAQGRVWTGQQALERGLVDTLGGLDTVVGRMRDMACLGQNTKHRLVWVAGGGVMERVAAFAQRFSGARAGSALLELEALRSCGPVLHYLPPIDVSGGGPN
jgi:protease-4